MQKFAFSNKLAYRKSSQTLEAPPNRYRRCFVASSIVKIGQILVGLVDLRKYGASTGVIEAITNWLLVAKLIHASLLQKWLTCRRCR